jgi:hypothetical protein
LQFAFYIVRLLFGLVEIFKLQRCVQFEYHVSVDFGGRMLLLRLSFGLEKNRKANWEKLGEERGTM